MFNLDSRKAADLALLLFQVDSVTNCNIYICNVTHDVNSSLEAVCDFHRAVKPLCSQCLVSQSGDCATRFIIASHLSPGEFESLLHKRFIKLASNPLFNIIF